MFTHLVEKHLQLHICIKILWKLYCEILPNMSNTVPKFGAKLIKLMTSRHVIRKTSARVRPCMRIKPTCFVGHSLLREKRSYVTRHKNCFPMCRVLQWCMWYIYFILYLVGIDKTVRRDVTMFAERVRILSRTHTRGTERTAPVCLLEKHGKQALMNEFESSS